MSLCVITVITQYSIATDLNCVGQCKCNDHFVANFLMMCDEGLNISTLPI